MYVCNWNICWHCVVPENIHTPPPSPRKGFAVWPPSPLDFPKSALKIYPPLPSGISTIFAQPLEILLSLIEVNKEVVFFTRMPNFVSFIYCITDKRIPYANSLCAQQILCISCNFYWILQFCRGNARSRSKHNRTFLALRQEESNTLRGTIKEIKTSSCQKKQCEYRISFYQICIFEFAIKLRFTDKLSRKV